MRNAKKAMLMLCLSVLLFSCSDTKINNEPELEKWQEDILIAEELPQDVSQLTELQKTRLNSIFEMEEYLRNKYNEEFVYLEYIPADLLESEKLIVYPQMTGEGNGKNIVTVKRDQNGDLTDDYYDYSVAEYAEKLIDDFLTSYFGEGNYLYDTDTNACDIKKSEIIDGDFQWKYGASKIIFIKDEAYDVDVVEKFAVSYAKFLYDHKISGPNRINVIKEFNTNNLTDEDITEMYKSDDYYGFYRFFFEPEKREIVHTISLIYDGEKRTRVQYEVDDYFKKIR